MKKIIYISILAASIIFYLQGIWIYNFYQVHLTEKTQILEKLLTESTAEELSIRLYSPFKDPNKQKFVIKHAKNMTPEERAKLKGDSLDIESYAKKHIGTNIYEIILQMQQDALAKKNKNIQLLKLDSIFQKKLHQDSINIDYCILLYDKDTIPVNHVGTLPLETTKGTFTQLHPIGTKGLQYIQVKAYIPLSTFIQTMLWILIESVLMVGIVIGCVIFLAITVKRKDELFKQREASVNGTVHDLKSPLNGVIAMLSYVKTKENDAVTLNLLNRTIKQTKNLASDIDALLITARKNRQKVYLQKEKVDLMELIAEVKANIAVQYDKPHTLNIHSSFDSLAVYADPLYMTNVIRNLVENALKYSDENVDIDINVSKEKDMAIFTVSDTGWGIEKKYHKKIFTQFFQVPRENIIHQRGYGIGLAFVKYIIEAHNGKISLKSQLGKGSTFTCKIPLAPQI